MKPDRWRELDRLFDAVVQLPSDQRQAYLRRNFDDPELIAEVNRLVEHDTGSGDFVAGVVDDVISDPVLAEQIGSDPDRYADEGSGGWRRAT